MKRLKGFTAFLASRMLTLWLAGMFIVYYLSMAVWSREAFGHLMTILSGNRIAQFLYLLLLLNMGLRTAQSLKTVWPEKSVFFLRIPLGIGVLLLLFAFFMSVNVRKNTWILAGEGDTIDVPWNHHRYRVVKIQPAIEKKTRKAENSVIFSSEPLITLLDTRGTSRMIGAFPPRLVDSTYMHILNFGIGPGVELRENKKTLVQTYVALRLMPFGSVDFFELPPSPYKFSIRILPNRVISKGDEVEKEYNLERPLYQVEIVKGDRVIMKAETDSGVTFDQIMALYFHPPSDWVMLELTYDPFLPFFAAGLALAAAGILLYPASFLSFRKRRHLI